MKKIISKVSIFALAILLLTSITGAAAIIQKHPAQTIAEITGKTMEEIKKEHNNGKSYGEIAKAYGVLDKYKVAKITDRKEKIDELVKQGKISAEEGKKMYEEYKAYLDKWDGTGNVDKKCKVGRRNVNPNREQK